jgi:lactate permease
MTIVLLSVVPILILLVGIGMLNKSTIAVSPLGWAVSFLIGVYFFGMNWQAGLNGSIVGALNGFGLIWIIFPILFLYQMLNQVGTLAKLKKAITNLTKESFLQLALLGFGFVFFINGIAGFGSAGALTATMLNSLGLSPVMSGAMVLLGVTPGTYTGSLGFSALATARAFNISTDTLTHYWSAQMPWWTLVTPWVLAWFLGGFEGLRKNWFSALILGVGGALGMWLALFLGWYQLVDVTTGLVAMLFGLLYIAILRMSGRDPRAPSNLTRQERFTAFFPFVFLFTVVIVTQAIPAIRKVLSGFVLQWTIAKGSVWKFDYLNQPGIWVLLTVVLLAVIFKVSSADSMLLLKKAARQSWQPAVALGFVMAMAQVMTVSGMNLALGKTVAAALGFKYIFLLPVIAAIGTFASGNSTASTLMLGSFHMTYAKLMGIDPILLLTLTAVSANVSNNIAPPKMVTVLAAVGGAGQDSVMMKKMLKPVAVYLVINIVLVAAKVFF